MRVAIGIEYAGNAFEGWQTQPHGRTVQDFLERALAQIAQEPVKPPPRPSKNAAPAFAPHMPVMSSAFDTSALVAVAA